MITIIGERILSLAQKMERDDGLHPTDMLRNHNFWHSNVKNGFILEHTQKPMVSDESSIFIESVGIRPTIL